MARAVAFLVLLIVAPAAYAVTYNVGDSSGWTNGGVDYDVWASGKNFVVGDTLVFTFDSSHAVDEVNRAAYDGCNTNGPISTSTSSPTTIALNATGPRYFICPRSNHCSQDQKLAITVRAGSTTPGGAPPPSTNGSTPSPPTETPATPGTPETPSAPLPPSGGAAGIMGGRSSFMVGLSLILAAVVGLMV